MELTNVPSPVLAKRCEPLDAADLKSHAQDALIAEMKNVMVANNGIGLAANQLGQDLQLFVIDEKLAAENEVPSVYANPEITEYGRETDTLEEGCLSIPGYWTPIRRAKKIMFKGLDEAGNRVKFRARGMLARVLQHETDHLNGLTIRDRSKKKTPRS
ncbi:MAG TPA: peptide deformylase [Candidatus Paceibacterota bacterium]|nr:peptide deformylase [Candidatus Paceibacterota bacterium]